MNTRIPFILTCLILLSISKTIGQTNSDLICFNHSLLVIDSVTYEAAVNSEFVSEFAYSHEKKLIGYEGFYLIGKTNYIELFHLNSFQGVELEKGEIWICTASLQANHINTLDNSIHPSIQFGEEDEYKQLSVILKDSIIPFTTREMKKEHYESWAKKEYHDSVSFLPVDYNSPKESDSSSNYLMNDVYGIGLSLTPKDNESIISYLKVIGYDSSLEINGRQRLSNGSQFIELQIDKKATFPTIKRFYIKLNKNIGNKTEIIGNSRIECEGESAIWIFD